MTTAETQNTGGRGGAFRRELGIIPGWAYVVAAIVFVVILFCFVVFVFGGKPVAPAPLFRVLIALIPSTVLACIVLMVGYVNRDAGRRGMSRTVWTLIVIFVPNALGFILYFLLRSPIRTQCAQCGTIVDARANFCPNCRYSFHPTCPNCKAAVRPTEKFCSNCGHELATQ